MQTNSVRKFPLHDTDPVLIKVKPADFTGHCPLDRLTQCVDWKENKVCHIKRVHITLTDLIANKKSNRYSAIFGNWESLSIHIVREGTFQVDKLKSLELCIELVISLHFVGF